MAQNLFIYVLRFLVGYIKSCILSWVILPIAGALIFISTAFSGSLEFVLRKISYLFGPNSDLLSGTFSISGSDIMKAFGIFSLALYIIIELLKHFGIKLKPSFKTGFLSISLVFGSVILLILYPTTSLNMTGSKSGFIFVFVIFWVVSILAYSLWYFLNGVKLKSKK